MAVIKTEDWESAASVITRYPDRWWDTNRPDLWPNQGAGSVMYVSSEQAYAGTKSLKSVFTGTQYDPVPPLEMRSILYFDASYDEIWVTWYEYMENGFITGGDSRIGGAVTKGWYLLTNSNVGGFVFNYLFGGREMVLSAQTVADATPAYDGYNMTQNVTSRSQLYNKWICYEARIKFNTPGSADGVYELYWTNMTDAPGTTVQVANWTGRQWRGPNSGSTNPSTNKWFAIEAYKQDGLGNLWRDNLTVSTTRVGATGTPPPPSDTTPPPVPNAPTITSGTSLPLVVTWTGVANPGDLAGYNYYRKTTACGGAAPTLIASLGNVLTYTDTTIPNDTTNVCISIASRDTSGNVSALSNSTGGALVPPAASVRHTVVTDPFTRANNTDLGALWDSGYSGAGSLQISSNQCIGSTTGTELIETYNGVSLPNDQWASVTLTHVSADGAGGVLLRWANAPTLSGYFFKVRPGNNPSSRIDKLTAGAFATLGSDNSATWAVGDTLIAEAEGTTLRLFRTDVSTGVTTKLIEVTDSTHTSGKAGIDMYCVTANNNFGVDDFTVGDFNAGTPTPDTFAHIASVTSDTTGADLTFTGLAHKIRYRDDLHPVTPVEVVGLGGVDTYRLSKVWEPEITFVCVEAQGSDGIWETDIDSASYICTGVTPGSSDVTAPDAPTGLEFY